MQLLQNNTIYTHPDSGIPYNITDPDSIKGETAAAQTPMIWNDNNNDNKLNSPDSMVIWREGLSPGDYTLVVNTAHGRLVYITLRS